MKVLLSIIACASVWGGCSYFNKRVGVSDDNIIEEMLEEKIGGFAGLQVDLSPETPE